jgi:hypothetical protein
MSNLLNQLFDYSGVVCFSSHGSVDTACARLAIATARKSLQAALSNEMDEATLVGSVAREGVKLHRVIFLSGNIFKPFFVGRWEGQDEHVRLCGKFTMGTVGRFAILLDVTVSVIAQLIMLPLIGTEQGLGNLWFFVPLVFGATGIVLALSCKWSGTKEVRWLEEQIARALA